MNADVSGRSLQWVLTVLSGRVRGGARTARCAGREASQAEQLKRQTKTRRAARSCSIHAHPHTLTQQQQSTVPLVSQTPVHFYF